MATTGKCDVAVWDVSGALLSDIRKQLAAPTQREGPTLSIKIGDWLQRRVVIGSPQPVIAKYAATFDQVFDALVTAHHPLRVLVVGPAGGGERSVGEVVVESAEHFMAPGIEAGSIGQGTSSSHGASHPVTTDWADPCRRAAEAAGLEVVMIAVVTAPGAAAPPVSRPRTRSRAAGVLLGKLLRGKQTPPRNDRRAIAAATDAVAAIVRSL